MRKYAKLCLILTCLLIIAVTTWATARFHQTFDSSGGGAFSNADFHHQQIADDFTLPTAVTLDSITWFGRYPALLNFTSPVSFSIRFFSDQGGLPAALPFDVTNVSANAETTGSTFGGLPWFSYSAPISVTLDPGVYWVSIVESDSRSAHEWVWGQSDTAGVRAFRVLEGSAWSGDARVNMAFTLLGPGGCNFSSESTEPERCFGGIGSRCEGTLGAPFTKDENTCLVSGWMSVGSIRHDRCCIDTNNTGFGCANWNGSMKCAREFKDAIQEVGCSELGSPRVWQQTFGPYPEGNTGDDVTQDLRAPAGARVDLKYQSFCPSGRCRTGLNGKTIFAKDGCGKYCICE